MPLFVNLNKKKDELEERGVIKGPNIRLRFARANMSEEYKSIYNFIAAESHNTLRSLRSRHIRIEGRDFRLVAFDWPGSMTSVILDSYVGLFYGSLKRVNETFALGDDESVSELKNALYEVRAFRDANT